MISQDNTYWVTQARPWQLAFYTPRWWDCMWALMVKLVAIFFIFLRCTFETKRKWNSRSYFTYRYVFNTVVLSETLVSVKSWNNDFVHTTENRLQDCTSFWLVQKPRWTTPKIPASQYRSIIILISFIYIGNCIFKDIYNRTYVPYFS